jgi:hypothetical protein
MTVATESARRLSEIEDDLREAARIRDESTRKVLTSILKRQAEHYRKLVAIERDRAEHGEHGPQD